MGQRQSSQRSDTPSENERPATASGRIRPPSRVQAQRDALRSAVIPVNENQRRDERRARRERLRESSEANIAPPTPTITPFSRMIASVISEAVLTSFRNGQMASLAPPPPPPPPPPPAAAAAAAAETDEQGQQQQANVRQQLTMHLSPELFQQMEPDSTEDSFMRFMRLPVIVSSVSTITTEENPEPIATATVSPANELPSLADRDGQVNRVVLLPVFLYGVRSFNTTSNTNNTNNTNNNNNEAATSTPRTGNRRSERLRAVSAIADTGDVVATASSSDEDGSPSPAAAAAAASGEDRVGSGQWTVYIISGSSVEGIMNDNPSYEELLDLATLIGPARTPTVSQEAINSHAPILKYTQQVKQTMVGNADGCQVCLSNYQSQDDVRVLACHHGFHQECIDTWLTLGKNQCPLCRDVPVPSSAL
ncbi:hypothetical protein INT47_010305 [Mucor saturninus]|uniref:RING-type E3 ubiquitin transferase n=1 Tax=Mucor saturninus TaxID=64648 RepID=A0A8H7QW64_9FUNG|nr:hypothetical protein INT47_010305 [Mucor saturninus]